MTVTTVALKKESGVWVKDIAKPLHQHGESYTGVWECMDVNMQTS